MSIDTKKALTGLYASELLAGYETATRVAWNFHPNICRNAGVPLRDDVRVLEL